MSALGTTAGAATIHAPSHASPRVLIIEDDPGLSQVMRMAAERRGFRVTTALDGAEGLDVARSAQHDVVLLDLMLPVIDGFTVLTALRAAPQTAQVPIIVVSARTADAERAHGLALGADDYLFKPFNVRDVIARAETMALRYAETGRRAAA